jgi:hypothetical protein
MKNCNAKLNASKDTKCLKTENKVTKVKVNFYTGEIYDENNNFLGYGTYKNGKITITK